jgi:hypothetical protein
VDGRSGGHRELIVKWHRAFNGLISGAALLLPLTAVPESRIDAGSASAASSAIAHVNFKIVIPQVLYLRVGPGDDALAGTQTMAIMSNGRNLTLNSGERATDSSVPARRIVILNASARRTISQQAQCTPTPTPPGTAPADSHDSAKMGTHAVVCTASMP